MRKIREDPSSCQPSLREAPLFDIGIPLWDKLEAVYETSPTLLTSDQKWIEWWKLLFPEARNDEIPNPRHQDVIIVSTAKIPALQETFHDMWKENALLPELDNDQKNVLSSMLGTLLRAQVVLCRHRPQSGQPRTPRTPALTMNMYDMAPATVTPSSYRTIDQESDYNWQNWNMNVFSEFNNGFGSVGPAHVNNGSMHCEPSHLGSLGHAFPDSGHMSLENDTLGSFSDDFLDNGSASFRDQNPGSLDQGFVSNGDMP
jgi:hypothetical protein